MKINKIEDLNKIDKDKHQVISDTKEIWEECEKRGIPCYSLLHTMTVMYWKGILTKEEFIRDVKKFYQTYKDDGFKCPDGRESILPKDWKDWQYIIDESIRNYKKLN